VEGDANEFDYDDGAGTLEQLQEDEKVENDIFQKLKVPKKGKNDNDEDRDERNEEGTKL
jgi:hypothetical protein